MVVVAVAFTSSPAASLPGTSLSVAVGPCPVESQKEVEVSLGVWMIVGSAVSMKIF